MTFSLLEEQNFKVVRVVDLGSQEAGGELMPPAYLKQNLYAALGFMEFDCFQAGKVLSGTRPAKFI